MKTSTSKSGFTIVELLIVIIVIGILAALVVVAFNSVQARATKAAMVADLNNVSKLVQNYYSEFGTYPTSLSQLNNGAGYTPTKNNNIQLSGSSSYCVTVDRNEQYMKYDSTTGNNADGFCAGHGPVAPATIAYTSGIVNYPTANTTYPLTPGVTLQPGDVVISFHTEHYIVGTAYMKLNGVNQTDIMTKSYGAGARVYRVTILNNVTSSSALSFTTDGSGVDMVYMVVRGLTNPTTFTSQVAGWSGSVVSQGTVVTVPSQSLKAGQAAIMGINTAGAVTYPTNPTPSLSNWIIDPSGTSSQLRIGSVMGTKDIPSVSAGVTATAAGYIGAAIFILGS